MINYLGVDKDLVDFMIKNNANPNIKDRHGTSTIELARDKGDF